MQTDSIHRRLRALIGSNFVYAGERWKLIDILPDSDCVVLRNDSTAARPVQTDLYGTPIRRSKHTITLPISGSDGQYSEEMKDLLAGKQ